jgi:hypothetical protein
MTAQTSNGNGNGNGNSNSNCNGDSYWHASLRIGGSGEMRG